MGTVLGVAVLLDAFLVRLVLLSVLLRLTGRAAWWVAAWLRRILPDIRFSTTDWPETNSDSFGTKDPIPPGGCRVD